MLNYYKKAPQLKIKLSKSLCVKQIPLFPAACYILSFCFCWKVCKGWKISHFTNCKRGADVAEPYLKGPPLWFHTDSPTVSLTSANMTVIVQPGTLMLAGGCAYSHWVKRCCMWIGTHTRHKSEQMLETDTFTRVKFQIYNFLITFSEQCGWWGSM